MSLIDMAPLSLILMVAQILSIPCPQVKTQAPWQNADLHNFAFVSWVVRQCIQ